MKCLNSASPNGNAEGIQAKEEAPKKKATRAKAKAAEEVKEEGADTE
jgi:hypothetical protein